MPKRQAANNLTHYIGLTGLLCLLSSQTSFGQGKESFFPWSSQTSMSRSGETANENTLQALPPAQKSSSTSWAGIQLPGRMIFLNGVNISNVREQKLENVNIFIDLNGNIHITAPHYEAIEETTYHPLLPDELPKFPKPQENPVPSDFPLGTFRKEKTFSQLPPLVPETNTTPSQAKPEQPLSTPPTKPTPQTPQAPQPSQTPKPQPTAQPTPIIPPNNTTPPHNLNNIPPKALTPMPTVRF